MMTCTVKPYMKKDKKNAFEVERMKKYQIN